MTSDGPATRLVRNAVRCLRCNTVIESAHRHDMNWCPCQAVAVDGGLDYLRRAWIGGPPDEVYEELSIVEAVDDAEGPEGGTDSEAGSLGNSGGTNRAPGG